MRWVPQSHSRVVFFISSDSGVQARQEPEEMEAKTMCTPSFCTRRRYSPTRWSVPGASSTKKALTGTPPMPPALLISSNSISAVCFAGTPKTEAAPERKVVMPTRSSVGLVCAPALPPASSRLPDVAAAPSMAARRETALVMWAVPPGAGGLWAGLPAACRRAAWVGRGLFRGLGDVPVDRHRRIQDALQPGGIAAHQAELPERHEGHRRLRPRMVGGGRGGAR